MMDLETLTSRKSILTFVPFQANASSSEGNDWSHLVCTYKSRYSAQDSSGNPLDTDNATIKTLKVKFSKESMSGVTPKMFKNFFDENFVGKQTIDLPILVEMPVYQNKVMAKNETQAVVSPDFSLSDFIRNFKKA